MNILWIIVSVLTFSASSIATRGFQLKCSRQERDVCLFQALYCLVGAVAYLLRAGFSLALSLSDGLRSALFGVLFASASLFSAFCYDNGPMSLTSVLVNCSGMVPVVYSCLLLREPITGCQLTGILLLIVTFVLSAVSKGSADSEKRSALWLPFVLIAFFSNGMTAVIQKQYKLSAPASDGNGFMGLAYAVAAVVLALAFLVKGKKAPESGKRFTLTPLCVLLILCAGLGSFVGNTVLLRLSTVVPAALLYPFVNGGLCVAVSVFSLAFFGENLTRAKAGAVLVGLTSIVLLNL